MSADPKQWSMKGATVLYWICIGVVPFSFLLPAPVFWIVAIVAVEVVIFGSHEALHATVSRRITPGLGECAAIFGYAVQGMNFYLLRPAHMRHHQLGRYDEGYAPDVVVGKPKLWQRLHYYAILVSAAALAYQLAGLCGIVGSKSKRFRAAKVSRTKWAAAQVAVVLFWLVSYILGGWLKVVIYESIFAFLWSLQQNVSHYGLEGVDPVTDRICANTYYLPWPLNLVTFGSTSHFLHHARPELEGTRLYVRDELIVVERRLGIQVAEKHGVTPFIFDLFRQFHGPIPESQLTTDWLVANDVARRRESMSKGYAYRQGRTYAVRGSQRSSA